MKSYLLAFILILGFIENHAQNRTTVQVLFKEDFTSETDIILNEALFLVDSVINSDAFRNAVLAAQFGNAKGLSNDQILELISSGIETHHSAANDTMDLVLKTYPDQRGDNIGTTMDSKVIVTSRVYMVKNGSRCYAAHLIHEYCHTIGYGATGFTHRHSVIWPNVKKKRKEKCTSVPYIVGDIARQILGAGSCNMECQNWVSIAL